MIAVQITTRFEDIEADLPRLKKLVKTVCESFNLSKATVGVMIVDDTRIAELNKQFLNRNASTDCLSFDLSEDNTKDSHSFEMAVNGERAVKQAKLRGHSSEAELALYITHGLLHNLGFDDSTPAKAKKMHQAEDEILQQAGYGVIYDS